MVLIVVFFFFKQKTAYDMRISDWSSDVCSSDLQIEQVLGTGVVAAHARRIRCGQQRRQPYPIFIGGLFQQLLRAQPASFMQRDQAIGRASWRERVCQYV